MKIWDVLFYFMGFPFFFVVWVWVWDLASTPMYVCMYIIGNTLGNDISIDVVYLLPRFQCV